MEKERSAWGWRFISDLFRSVIVRVLAAAAVAAAVAFVPWAKAAFNVSPWLSVALVVPLLVLTACIILMQRGRPEWDADRAKKKDARHVAERLLELRDGAHHLLTSIPHPDMDSAVTCEEWCSAVERVIDSAEHWSTKVASIPRDVGLLIRLPKNRPPKEELEGRPATELLQQIYRLRLYKNGLEEGIELYCEREGIKVNIQRL